MAPEIITEAKYGRKSDVYSFGILMYEVVTDSFPYPDIKNGKLSPFMLPNKVANDNYRPIFKNPIKKSIEELITQCWSANPTDRPTFSELFKKLTNQQYFLDDVESEKIEIYVKDITMIDDPIEKLNYDVENLEKQNQNLKKN